MKYTILLVISLLVSDIITAQPRAYFQQEVRYRIRVVLDDQQHSLRGELDLYYTNNSPDTLRFIWMHLWPNAYQDQTTAFARQQSRIGNTEFYFAKDNQLGRIDSLDFRADGQVLRRQNHEQHPDITRIWLPKPLAPGETVLLQTPFYVIIPHSFSRLGHIGQSYQITQWYPKPAVYDADGWHPMPYLDQGEFYSEFGTYDVWITLPENYVVGATGVLQTATERAFLQQRAEAADRYLPGTSRPEGKITDAWDPFPPSSERQKTIHYRAENVHDFAWFADKRFYVQHSQVALTDGRTVDTWVMYTDVQKSLWEDAIDYVDRAVAFYSDVLGPYPYPQATAVQSALSAGGGMEYPMITVIDLVNDADDLDEVITHEVGHNWLYGILAFNERDHPWLDEGLNSYYERRYMRRYYPDRRAFALPEMLTDGRNIDVGRLAYIMLARRRHDQPPATSSDELTSTNYWVSAYTKPALLLEWLAAYVGQERFDQAMQQFYRQWQFRHPGPDDLRAALEAGTGRDLKWLFDDLLFSDMQVDYAVTGLDRSAAGWSVTVENRGEVDAPFPLSAERNGGVVWTKWVEGFSGRQTIVIPLPALDLVVIDPSEVTLDIYRHNNRIRAAGLLPGMEPVRLQRLVGIDDDRYSELYWLPAPAWNAYDGWQAGLLLHNRAIPQPRLGFHLLPMYAFKSRSFTGLGQADYAFYPAEGWFERWQIGLSWRRFHYNRDAQGRYDLQYTRWQPFIELGLRRPKGSTFAHGLRYRLIRLSAQRANFGNGGEFTGLTTDRQTIHEWSYRGENKRSLNPYTYHLAIEQQAYDDVFDRQQRYLKWSAEWRSELAYGYDREVSARLFLGGFLNNSRRQAGAIFPGAFDLIGRAASDYRFDDLYFGRSEREGWWSRQLSLRDGGMKIPLSPAFNLGRSNSFIAAVNLQADLPFAPHIPLKPYFDIGYFDNAMPTSTGTSFADQLLWSGGLGIELLDDRFGLYLPLLNSENVRNRLSEQGNFWSRISFRLNLVIDDPRDLWIRSLQ